MDNTNPNSITPSFNSPTAPSLPPVKKNKLDKKKTFFLVALILFMVSAIGVGLFAINQQKSTRGEASVCTISPIGGESGWVTTSCGPQGPADKSPDGFHYQRYNCHNCRSGGFVGNVDPRQGPLGKYQNKDGVVRYKCARTQSNKADAVVMEWYSRGCNVGVPGLTSVEPGVGSVDENFCGMQQIDRNGTFYSYWNLTNPACAPAQPQPTPTPPTVTPTISLTPTNTPTPTGVITPTPTNTPTPTPTNTPTPTGILTPTPTGTLTPTATPTTGPSATPTEVILAKNTPTPSGTVAPTIPSAGSSAGVFFMAVAGVILATLLFVF